MRARSADTDPSIEQVHIALLRRATVAKRLALATSLSETVIGLARRAIRRSVPALDEQGLALRFVEIHYGPGLANDLRVYLAQRRR